MVKTPEASLLNIFQTQLTVTKQALGFIQLQKHTMEAMGSL